MLVIEVLKMVNPGKISYTYAVRGVATTGGIHY